MHQYITIGRFSCTGGVEVAVQDDVAAIDSYRSFDRGVAHGHSRIAGAVGAGGFTNGQRRFIA